MIVKGKLLWYHQCLCDACYGIEGVHKKLYVPFFDGAVIAKMETEIIMGSIFRRIDDS